MLPQKHLGYGSALAPDVDMASQMLNWFSVGQHCLKGGSQNTEISGCGTLMLIPRTKGEFLVWQNFTFVSILEGPYLHREAHQSL